MHEIGSEFDWDSNQRFIRNDSLHPNFIDGYFFRSGRDALRLIANKHKGTSHRILMPSLCCESMVLPFRQLNFEIVYYRINRDMTACFDDIISKVTKNDIVLYMDYFGITSLNEDQLLSLSYMGLNLVFVDDITHNPFSKVYTKFHPDYSVLSIRKWFAIPDGGILFSKEKFDYDHTKIDNFFNDTRKQALQMKSKYLRTHDKSIKEMYRRLFSLATNYIDENNKIEACSVESMEIIRNIDFDHMNLFRHNNLLALQDGLGKNETIRVLDGLNIADPILYFPIIVRNRDVIQNQLAKIGIYCPVIWPLPVDTKGVSIVAEYISDSILAIPCDHRYTIEDMEIIIDSIQRIVGEFR